MKRFVFASLGLLGAVSSLHAAEISPEVRQRLFRPGSTKVIITFKDKTNRSKLKVKSSGAEIKRTLRANYTVASRSVKEALSVSNKQGGGQVVEEFWAANAMSAIVSNRTLENLVENEDIEQITLDRIIPLEELPKTDGSEEPATQKWTYGLTKLGVDKVREAFGLTGKGVKVGILDTGIDAEHPDLKGKVIAWKDWAGSSEKPKDANGHGTHCAGTIAGGDASGTQIGVAPNASLIIGRIFGDNGSASLSGILGAMNWMTDPDGDPDTDDAPDLISNSWGGRKGSMDSEKSMWNLVKTWRSLNIVPVFAAGNSGPGSRTVGTPGGYPHSFAVGATDSRDKAAYFSSRGPIEWEGVEYIKPDIAAPGVDIYSAKPGGGYQKMSGTSMACPHVAGLVALMLEANPALTVEQVEKALGSVAVDLGKEGKDDTYGDGRADILATIEKIKTGTEVRGKNFDSIFDESHSK